jgi:hypothetical protein
MGMLAAAGIEARAASGAVIPAGQIFVYGQFVPAYAAENRLLVKTGRRTDGRGVAGRFFMTKMARVVRVAAGELDGDNVERTVIMLAPRFTVDRLALDLHELASIRVGIPLFHFGGRIAKSFFGCCPVFCRMIKNLLWPDDWS